MPKSTTPRVLGLSTDGRTNRWQVSCPVCGKEFIPVTTRCSTQQLTCPNPRCRAELLANYNAEPPVVETLGE